MKTRKLSSDEVLEIVKGQFRQNDPEFVHYGIKQAEEKIKYIESLKLKSGFSKWIDRNQGNFWFFIMITAVLFTAKVAIEAYLLNK